MNIRQRLTKLEQVTSPTKDTREPVLLKFIGHAEPYDEAGILMIFRNGACESIKLNSQQLVDYEASELPAEIWVNTVPRPARIEGATI